MAVICFCLEPLQVLWSGFWFLFSVPFINSEELSSRRVCIRCSIGLCIIHSPVTRTLQGVAPTIRLQFGEFQTWVFGGK